MTNKFTVKDLKAGCHVVVTRDEESYVVMNSYTPP